MTPTVTVGEFPQAVAVDHRTDTANREPRRGLDRHRLGDQHTHLQRPHQPGCGNLQRLQVPSGNPDDIAVNPATDTVYVATTTSSGPDIISVFNGATCNATTTLGCDQNARDPRRRRLRRRELRPQHRHQPEDQHGLRHQPRANTIPFTGNSVYVIDGATCDAQNTTGCDQLPAAVTISPNPPVGSNPTGIAVDERTNTIYTANLADGEHAGTVSVIDGANCNGHDTTGCSRTPATAPAEFGSNGIAIDHTTHEVYVTNIEDTSVSVINGATCNGSDTTGCPDPPTDVSVGNYPSGIAVDPTVASAYVSNFDNTISVIPLHHS